MAFKTIIGLILLLMGIATISARKAITAVIFFAVTSTFAAILFALYRAPDVALAEVAIGAAFTSFLYLIALQHKGKLWVALVEVKGGLNVLEKWILEGFCERYHLELKLVPFPDISRAKEKLDSGEVEMIAGGIVSTPSIIHTVPFLETKVLLLTRSDKNIKTKDLGLSYFNTPSNEGTDVIAIDLMRYRNFLLSNLGVKMEVIKQINGLGYVFEVRADDKTLLKQLNDFILEAENTGRLKEGIGRFVY
ncbi:MAG: DUF4040 domain-containing protein [Thermotogae bacterium]|nr:DUF4040 domain-containing protein [Thermotogota bacterium]